MKTTKTRSAKPAPPIHPATFERILEDYKTLGSKRLRAFDLRQFGYQLDQTHKIKGANFEMWMVLDEDNRREVGFAYLVMNKNVLGACMPHSFSYYMEPTVHEGESR